MEAYRSLSREDLASVTARACSMARTKVLAGGLASPVEIEQAFWSGVPEFLSRWL